MYERRTTENIRKRKQVITFLALIFMMFLLPSCTIHSPTSPVEPPAAHTETSESMMIQLYLDNQPIAVVWETSQVALEQLLDYVSLHPINLELEDYGNFEKLALLPLSLTTNNTQITALPGDIILYLGTTICLYYDTNTWSYTKLGRMEEDAIPRLKQATTLELRAIPKQ
ncbi:MAG: cyclophilin-like fold protein [Erysipelotrichaceae bacterium]